MPTAVQSEVEQVGRGRRTSLSEDDLDIDTDGHVFWDGMEQMTQEDAEYHEHLKAHEKFIAGLPPYPGTPTIPSPDDVDEDKKDSPTSDIQDAEDEEAGLEWFEAIAKNEEAAFEELIFWYKNMERLSRDLKARYGDCVTDRVL